MFSKVTFLRASITPEASFETEVKVKLASPNAKSIFFSIVKPSSFSILKKPESTGFSINKVYVFRLQVI